MFDAKRLQMYELFLNQQNVFAIFLFSACFFLQFAELFLQSIHAIVDTFFKSVANFRCKKLIVFYLNLYVCLLVEGCFRLHHLQGDFDVVNLIVETLQFRDFLLDEATQLIRSVEVNGLNSNFHNYLLFLWGAHLLGGPGWLICIVWLRRFTSLPGVCR